MGIPDDQIKNAAVASEAVDMDGTAEATDRADDVDTQDGLYLIGGDHCGGLTHPSSVPVVSSEKSSNFQIPMSLQSFKVLSSWLFSG